MNIHCLGDSIVEASGLPECGRWTVILQRLLDADAPHAHYVFNHGVGGNTSAMGLDRMRNEMIGKDITLIQFGLNDCACRGFSFKNRVGFGEYLDNLRAIARIVSHRGGQPVLVANHLAVYHSEIRQPDGELYSDKIRQYNEGVRSVAAELNLLLIDMEAHFASAEFEGQSLRADGLHLNLSGNQVYAHFVYSRLEFSLTTNHKLHRVTRA